MISQDGRLKRVMITQDGRLKRVMIAQDERRKCQFINAYKPRCE